MSVLKGLDTAVHHPVDLGLDLFAILDLHTTQTDLRIQRIQFFNSRARPAGVRGPVSSAMFAISPGSDVSTKIARTFSPFPATRQIPSVGPVSPMKMAFFVPDAYPDSMTSAAISTG